MSSPNNSVPMPIEILLETEVDEECSVFLQFDHFQPGDEYTTGKLIAASDITSATYSITEEFSIPCKNIRDVTRGNADTGVNQIWLDGRDDEELAQLFNMVTFNYQLGGETKPELSEDN